MDGRGHRHPPTGRGHRRDLRRNRPRSPVGVRSRSACAPPAPTPNRRRPPDQPLHKLQQAGVGFGPLLVGALTAIAANLANLAFLAVALALAMRRMGDAFLPQLQASAIEAPQGQTETGTETGDTRSARAKLRRRVR
ncbi:DUF6251 family protein [Streptomyces sp. 2RAF24]|uniref:DUF6251 family protein n=1 Tax=Streptomyces sp. 2RAF24 TaxID=3232997 RepID=UPI003F944B34